MLEVFYLWLLLSVNKRCMLQETSTAHLGSAALQLNAFTMPSSSAIRHSHNPPAVLLPTKLQPLLQSRQKPSQTLAAPHPTLAVCLTTLATATGAAWGQQRGLLQKLLSSWPCCPWTGAELPLVSSLHTHSKSHPDPKTQPLSPVLRLSGACLNIHYVWCT